MYDNSNSQPKYVKRSQIFLSRENRRSILHINVIDVDNLGHEEKNKLERELVKSAIARARISENIWSGIVGNSLGNYITDYFEAFAGPNIDFILDLIARYTIRQSEHASGKVLSSKLTDEKDSRLNRVKEIILESFSSTKEAESYKEIIRYISQSMSYYAFIVLIEIYETKNNIKVDSDIKIDENGLYDIFVEFFQAEIIDSVINVLSVAIDNFAFQFIEENKDIHLTISEPSNVETDSPNKVLKFDNSRNIFNSEISKIATDRIFGMGLEAQHKTPDWVAQDLEQSTSVLSHSMSDTKDRFQVIFYLGKNESGDIAANPSAHIKSVATEILQRWGITHARLYVSIGIAITKMKGEMAEFREADLLKAVGMDTEVRQGNMLRKSAIAEIFQALNDLKLLCIYITSQDGKYISGKFPMYQIEPLPIYKLGNDIQNDMQSLRARVAPGLWAKDLFNFTGGPIFEISTQILKIPPKRYPLIASFALWIAYNRYLLNRPDGITLEKILRQIIPIKCQDNRQPNSEITWEILEPDNGTILEWTSKNARSKVRRQFLHAPDLLRRHGIDISYIGFPTKSDSTWQSFLDARVKSNKTNIHLIKTQKKSKKPKNTSQSSEEVENIRLLLKRKRITQKVLAAELMVSQSLVSRWLNGAAPIPENMMAAIHRLINFT